MVEAFTIRIKERPMMKESKVTALVELLLVVPAGWLWSACGSGGQGLWECEFTSELLSWWG